MSELVEHQKRGAGFRVKARITPTSPNAPPLRGAGDDDRVERIHSVGFTHGYRYSTHKWVKMYSLFFCSVMVLVVIEIKRIYIFLRTLLRDKERI